MALTPFEEGRRCSPLCPSTEGTLVYQQCLITEFSLCQGPSSNCQEYQNKGYKITNVLPIQVPGMPVFDVQCDMETDGGGWIVLQRRVDASVDFYRKWNEYKAGFGDLNGNFWLGLERIHKLAGSGKGAILRVDLKHISKPNELKYAEYSRFEISNEADGYRLTVGGYSGTAGDSLSYHSGMKFTTKDRDNDLNPNNCAAAQNGAWWYRSCHYSNLNGLFVGNAQNIGSDYMSWYHLLTKYGGITFSKMKIRYSNG